MSDTQSPDDSTNATIGFPLVINTWPFKEAGLKAWEILSSNGSALDAVEKGCATCERLQCDGTVGFGGSPDENGETTLDAMIMDGETHKAGSVAALRRVKDAISVARQIMERTKHTLLVGDQATQFAKMMGFSVVDLSTRNSRHLYDLWEERSCQPNFWQNVIPDPTQNCGPYRRSEKVTQIQENSRPEFGSRNHDTIGMVAIDKDGRMAVGTSTNGAINKIPGRVGDSPIVGSGAYVDKDVGGAAATGDGDIMMRFLPSFVAVEGMRSGLEPSQAAKAALDRILAYHSDFAGAVVATTKDGVHGAACHGFDKFGYVVGHRSVNGVKVINVECSK